jgi:hypothetical protein
MILENSEGSQVPKIQIIDFHCERSAIDEFGTVAGSYIIVRVLLITSQVRENECSLNGATRRFGGRTGGRMMGLMLHSKADVCHEDTLKR